LEEEEEEEKTNHGLMPPIDDRPRSLPGCINADAEKHAWVLAPAFFFLALQP
jgi:hypothetical protein